MFVWQAYLKRSTSQVVTAVGPILGVFQKLVAARSTEEYGFQLLSTFILHVPL